MDIHETIITFTVLSRYNSKTINVNHMWNHMTVKNKKKIL